MTGVDTNVLVRFLVGGDHTEQSALARQLFSSGVIAVAHTVLLEAEWVLRASFRFSHAEIAGAFLRLLGMPTVEFNRKDAVLLAVRAFQNGVDFADALHVTTSAVGVSEFATFDHEFARRAKAQALLPPVRLLQPN